jgi:hypothetical protein
MKPPPFAGGHSLLHYGQHRAFLVRGHQQIECAGLQHPDPFPFVSRAIENNYGQVRALLEHLPQRFVPGSTRELPSAQQGVMDIVPEAVLEFREISHAAERGMLSEDLFPNAALLVIATQQ